MPILRPTAPERPAQVSPRRVRRSAAGRRKHMTERMLGDATEDCLTLHRLRPSDSLLLLRRRPEGSALPGVRSGAIVRFGRFAEMGKQRRRG